MLYNKPKDMKYTTMCIWIDEHAYDEDVDEEKLFEYLYHLCLMLARKQQFFKRQEYYDDFAIYFATKMFLRLKNPKQFQINENGEPKLAKIKSILNYLKKTAYPEKVRFEQQEYSQSLVSVEEEDQGISEYMFSDMLCDSIDKISSIDFEVSLYGICGTAKDFIYKLPYKTDKVLINNIYISCLLTFLNSLTLNNKELDYLYSLQNTSYQKIECYYKKHDRCQVILYHLDSSMRDYIWVVTQEMKHAIAKDLSLNLKTYIPAESGLRTVVLSELNNSQYMGMEDDYN